MKFIDYLLLFIKGMISGIANVIPGVSGGTMTFILGIYDQLTDAIGNFFFEIKNWTKTRKRIIFIAVFGAGSGVAFWAFANILDYLLNQDLSRQFTCLFFIGLILGSIPYVMKVHDDMKINFKRVLLFTIALAAVILLAFISNMDASAVTGFAGEKEITPLYALWLFVVGILSAGSMILPGFSGSALMISLGEYYNMIHYSSELINHLLAGEFHKVSALYMLFLCAGTPVGSILVSKAINVLLKKHPSETYYFILGLLVASIYQIWGEIQSTLTLSAMAVVISLVCLGAGFAAAYGLSKIKRT